MAKTVISQRTMSAFLLQQITSLFPGNTVEIAACNSNELLQETGQSSILWRTFPAPCPSYILPHIYNDLLSLCSQCQVLGENSRGTNTNCNFHIVSAFCLP
mmetsp:Transcript_15612/g.18244  ORF Transcript_15612/g.18244 Transcript_15612/m.18244 type:complete len:101 (-) Transcript_15612:400-702(-)